MTALRHVAFAASFFSLFLSLQVASAVQQTSKTILDVFPDSTVNVNQRKGTTKLTSTYSPGKSIWSKGLDEQQVFQAEMVHEQDPENSFRLRIGKGGQVYSLRGPFGESVPPSYRSEKSSKQSPWNDEVWQFVAVCTRYNGTKRLLKTNSISAKSLKLIEDSPFSSSFFVHNSGAYIPGGSKFSSLYCPMLANHQDKKEGKYQILNWGLVPQIKSIHRSPILYYTQVRDAGDGVIELTWVVHNFSTRDDVVFDHLNAPWGGTRISSLPYRYVVLPDGKCVERDTILNRSGATNVRNTAGFNLTCSTESEDCPAIALVYGRDKHLESEQQKKSQGEAYCQTTHSLYRDWRASEPAYKTRWKDWKTRAPNSFRNYDVCEIIPKLKIEPGTSIWFRSYLVVGNRDRVMEQARKLVNEVDYGLRNFEPEAMPRLQVSTGSAEGTHFSVFAKPVAGSMPLFQILNETTGQQIVTTDPYFFVKKEKLDFGISPDDADLEYFANATGYSLEQHNSRWQSLLGYGYRDKPSRGNWKQLSELLDTEKFPASNEHHLDLWVEIQSAGEDAK